MTAQGSDKLYIEIDGREVAVSLSEVPLEIREMYPGFEIHHQRLWNLDLPVKKIAVDRLTWITHLRVWPENRRPFAVRPIDVMRYPETHDKHADQVQRSSLDFPIDVFSYRERLVILDGCHRLCKALMNGHLTVRVREVPLVRIPEIIDWRRTHTRFELARFLADQARSPQTDAPGCVTRPYQ